MKRSKKSFKFNIAIGSDHGGFRVKERIIKLLKHKRFKVTDLGTYSEKSCDYPKVAFNVAKAVGLSKFNRGILVCKSGIGNCIVANKIPGVRAALCYNVKAARLSREHNDANVLVLGAFFIKRAELKRILDIWLKTKFVGGRHKRRLAQITKMEKKLYR